MSVDNAAIQEISITEEMKRSYLDYAMSVIVSRAIPDVRDGLKPVHRRILYGMLELGTDWNKPYKKSARIVGDVMGKFHPHGDSAIYDSLVRMAQPFSMRLPLVDGQGNFGSMDGDNAAAMRYTESRLARVAHHLLNDIDKETVNFQPNYDGSEQEPMVLPAEFPNILVNGAGGIAVGMATNIPPHNLGEVIDACCLLIDQPDATIDQIMEIVPGPDFPTGALILGRAGSNSALRTGRGSVIMRAKTEIEEINNGKSAIIVTEIPYQVNKSRLVERIAELVREKKIEGISDLRDESDKSGVRVVIETKRDAVPEVVLNQLFVYTPLQTSFGVNMLALDQGRPRLMNIQEVLQAFLKFREEVITRRTFFLLSKVRDRAHVLIGLAIAVANIDEIIRVIRAAKDPVEAKEGLMNRGWPAHDVGVLLALVDDSDNEIINNEIRFTDTQAKAILELRLQRLTGLEREKIDNELQELAVSIREYLGILGNREIMQSLMRAELVAIRDQFANPRRSIIEMAEFEHDIEELIAREEMVVTVTAGGYIKRVPLSAYRAQRRGGKGKSGMSMRDEDITTEIFVTNTHNPVLFFSTTGKVYKLKVYRLPQGTPQSRGKALINIFPLAPGETIQTFMPLPEDEKKWDDMNIFFATAKGNGRRNDLSDFHNIMSNGKIAMKLDEGDSLIGVATCQEGQHVLLAAKSGKCVRFPVGAVRVFRSRTSDGVRAMKLAGEDEVVSMSILEATDLHIDERYGYLRRAAAKRRVIGVDGEVEVVGAPIEEEGEPGAVDNTEIDDARFAALEMQEQMLLTITENGFGKRSSAFEYRTTNRGTSGITGIVTSARNGAVVGSFPVEETDDLMLITDKGKVIRTPVADIRIAGRNTQGVTIFKMGKDEHVVSAVRFPKVEGQVEEDELDTAEIDANDIAPDASGGEDQA